MAKTKKKPPVPPGFKLVFRAWITGKDGKRKYATSYGLRAWPLLVPVNS